MNWKVHDGHLKTLTDFWILNDNHKSVPKKIDDDKVTSFTHLSTSTSHYVV